jgi:ABC-type cobalamin/Fe3+-siderophores transport system ATPase subunit
VNRGTSPAASGPAGALFEGQVGAFFLLSLLVRAEPRGLPGTTIDRVEFQRAAEGYPLDDIIVHAHDVQGHPAVLEVQVKRGITFAPQDPVFRSVVAQIVLASRKPEFATSRYELAIAISRTSQKIDGPYQDALTWARALGDAATFVNRINRAGSANESMRTFVSTFRSHLREEGVAHDDDSVWQLLRRLQILVFDFTAVGSSSEELAKERTVRALHPNDGSRAAELWTVLTTLSIEMAVSGGDRKRDALNDYLGQKSFRLAADQRTFSARSALAEASRNALADISDRVGGVTLARHERLRSVRAALDSGRYVEIRGDAGVGKSGLLKHFAEQISAESHVVVLNPERTVPRGWLAMRAALGFDGTARDLLSDLAANGGCVLFLDNLDFFDDQARLTAIDLLRGSAQIPGMSVIATCRRNFGASEPSWLPSDVIDQMGRAEPVIIYELSDDETDELRNSALHLRSLLADNHPARAVARNLFRLSRLASSPFVERPVRTEVEMAERWWDTADGQKDANHRERSRVLKALATQALTGASSLNVSALSSPAVNALVHTATLRDLGGDSVAFTHDVLRDWAIANLLIATPSLIGSLSLDRPAPAGLSRGVELAARMMIEHATDSAQWKSLLDTLSKEGAHGSWRWPALLALVRSETGLELLNKASALLLDDRAKTLRELIRLVMALDASPAVKWFTDLGLDPQMIPANTNVPSGPSWSRLIRWLLSLGDSLPVTAVPDVVDLYVDWATSMLGQDPLTPALVPWLFKWLIEIEAAEPSHRSVFNGELARDQLSSLTTDLRTGFLAFCNHRPGLAKSYLQLLTASEHRDQTLLAVIKNSGALSQAAPVELAQATASFLIPKNTEEADGYEHPFNEPFGHRDMDFIPASPSQGPFLQLLINAPETGLKLIRQLVDHAISHYTKGRPFGANNLVVEYLSGAETNFPWVQSYGWSRDNGSGPAVTASALMALEAWEHRRIEAGESANSVLTDITATANPAAAYLLVIIDLLLSHWPETRVAAIPFIACPELLCLDRQRLIQDATEIPDIFGLRSLQREPIGATNIESLKSRPSRKLALDDILAQYALDDSPENRDQLAALLRRTTMRLGPPGEQANLGDPEFMAIHALNLIDPKNWRQKILQSSSGPQQAWEYVPPEEEGRHLLPLQEAARERQADFAMETRVQRALDNSGQSSPSFAASAIEWARRQSAADQNGEVPEEGEDSDFRRSMRKETVVTAALIAARDGDAVLIAENEDWIRHTLRQALKSPSDPVHTVRAGLRFNPIAIAFAGIALLLKRRFAVEDVQALLESASDENPAASHGFTVSAALLAEIDQRLPRSILRCAFAGRIRPHRDWRKPEGEYNAQAELWRKAVRDRVEAELAWLTNKRDEPDWPRFPANKPTPRRRVSRERRSSKAGSEPTPKLYAEHQGAALWLEGPSHFPVAKHPWLHDIVSTYGNWTFVANGSELEGKDTDTLPNEWNDRLFTLLAHCLPGMTPPQIDEVALNPIANLPERAFLDVAATFLRQVDSVYFNEGSLRDAQALQIRTALWKRILTTSTWAWQVREHSTSTTMSFGPAIAALLFNNFSYFQPPTCYLRPPGIERIGPFLPLLKEIAETSLFPLAAVITLNLLEVAPHATHLPVIVGAGNAWLGAFPDDRTFWVDREIGARLCSLIEVILRSEPNPLARPQPLGVDLDRLLSGMIRLGLAEAHRLQEKLRPV